MSNCMDRLASIVSLAKSSKVTDYKKAIKSLLEFWDDNSELAFNQITEYSNKPSSSDRFVAYSWTEVFLVVHELFLNEIDRIGKLSGNSGKLDKERITKLVYITSDKANFHLKPKDVVLSTLQVLQNGNINIFSEFYEMYLGILRKYVLQERAQRILVNPDHWQELLEVCFSKLENVTVNVDYVKLLEAVELIVRYGCSLSNLLFESRKLLPVIGKLFENYESYRIRSTDILFKLSFTVCQQIATDSRFILCRFAETIPLSMIDIKGPDEKYKLYLLFVQVHHPKGAILGDSISYAYDEDKWKAILNLLYKMMLSDIKSISLPRSFIALSCEVLRQRILTKLPNLSQSISLHDSVYIQPRKKRRISDEQEKLVDLVNERDPERAWPIIQIAIALYSKYPECLKVDEYVEFLDIIIKLISQACKNFAIIENLFELTSILIHIESRYETDDLKHYWDKIWDAVLRFLSITHREIVQKAWILVQNLISYQKVSNPKSLLKLYLTQSIQWSKFSVDTLKLFCENIVLPNEIEGVDINSTQLTNNSIKLQLLKWALSKSNRLTNPSFMDQFSKLLIGFTLKSWYKSQDISQTIDHIMYVDIFCNEMDTVTIQDIERCYLTFNVKSYLPINESVEADIKVSDEKIVDNPYVPEDLDFLINGLLQSVQISEEVDVCGLITNTSLIAKVISNLKSMKMVNCEFDEFCLVKELQICLPNIFELVQNIHWSKNIRYTLEITKALTLLYQTKYDVLVNEIILRLTNFQILKKIYDITKIKRDEFDKDSKVSQCKINAIIVMALYCCINAGEEVSELQLKIMSTLLRLEKYNLSDNTDVVCVTNMLEIFSNMPAPTITETSIELLMDFITELFQEWQKDDKVSRYLLQVLPKILDTVTCIKDADNNVHNLLLICKIFHDQFAKGRFGQLTHLSLVQCLNKVIQHNIFNKTEIVVLNQEVFITFVNSPYYLVRLESLKCIYSVFSLGKIDHSWKSDFYDKLQEAVYKIFLIQRELTDSEIQEERYLRSVSVMQILATVICSKSVFQCAALFALLKVTVDKDIDKDMVKDITTLMNKSIGSSKNIIEENLNYLLTSWSGVHTLENFPYGLLDCANEAHFYDRYIDIIFPVLMRERKINEARNVCDKIGTSFVDVFKVCCSNIVPWTLTEEYAETFKQLTDNTGDFQGIGSYTALIKDNLQQVIQQIIQRLHDLNDFYSTFDAAASLPATDPPHFKCDVVDQCLDNLLRVVSSDSRHSIFSLIMTRKPSTFQKILLHLTCNIYACRISEYKAKAFHQYVYLCSKIVEELKQKHCKSVAQFFVKDIGCTLLNLSKESDAFIAKLACKYLHTFFQNVLPERSAEVGNFLSLCVKTLTPLIRNPNENSTPKAVLLFLLKEQKHCFGDAMETLGCLPSFIINTTTNQETESQILKENLEHFLNASDDESCSVDSLANLRRQLKLHRRQLEELYEELQSIQGFAEECAASLLHRLVYRLIRLTESRDIRVGLEAAKCLGVLGPADLATMILHPQETQKRESLDKADLLTHRICRLLADLLVSGDIELRRVSSEVLYHVFESPWGARVDLTDSEYGATDAFISSFLYPFRGIKSSTSSSKANLQVNETELKRVFNSDNSIWSQESNGPYQQWLANITSAVANCLTGFYSKSLLPIFKLNVQFCEIVLPRLVSLLVDVKSNHAATVCQCINRFFEYHFCSDEVTMSSTQPQYIQNCAARDAIKCMLEVVNHLRVQSREEINLAFDYLPIAMAAQFCSAYFSSVLYAELWCLSNLNTARDFDSIPMIDQIYEQDNKKGKIAQDILKEAYVKIGDSDSIYGCGSSHLQNRCSRIPYYTNFQKLDKLILSHDVELSEGNVSARGLITALRESSLHYLVKRLLSSNSILSDQIDPMEDLCYDSLWRLSDWSQITSIKASQTHTKVNDFSTCHYEALKSLHEHDNSSVEDSIEQAYFCVMKELCNMSLESCKAVYPKLSQLQMLREIEELNTTNPEDYKNLLSSWEGQKYIFNNNFKYIEPILSQRAVMFKIRDPIKSTSCIKNALIDVHLETARLAREQGHLNVAARALETLSKETNLDEEAQNRLLYHEARLAWMRKDEDMARFNLRNLIKKESINPRLLARALRVYGNWIAENKSENPQAIISKYYEKAIETYLLMPVINPDDVSDGSKARAALAQFAHEQYLVITDYMKSPQFESLKECIDYSRNAVPKTVSKNDEDVYRAVSNNTRQNSIDCLELENIHKDRDTYLALALKNYSLTLQDSSKHDFLIFRLVSLWLDNMNNLEVNKLLEKDLKKIPSYKFIALIPQLAPHLSNSGDVFSRKIGHVLERCAEEHPHHTLPVILALKNLYNDAKYCNKKITKTEPRVAGAQQLVQKLLSSNIRPIIQEMDLLSDALVMLAYLNSEKKQQSTAPKCAIPRSAPLHHIKDFKHSIVPTLAINIKRNGNYTNIVSVMKYDSSYSNVGGINAPKKITCIGSDGIQRTQLVKGKDDLRQDAVMQQVFTVMNSLLKTNKDAKQRKLYVRTYKVVPLTQRSGVLQWCENTMPLSMILTGDGSSRNPGLHRKYYPHDYAPNDCRRRLMAIKDAQQRYNGFIDCCKNLRPAFHHFFTENYLSPETWFERRLAYTRSVATTSIIGYILGLGDRHVSNILLDKSTAEVIHIDFGIAFEQGKLLPTPETVPFRLTRDMEAAMGVSGVEGTMRRCCEETMAVLREQKEIIVTLLKVLLYDPLYSWAITPAKAATYQSEHSSRSSENKESNSPGAIETNKLAERALLRVQQKLQGIEEGVASSTAGQVERLIQQARDPANLSKLFGGWQAYL